MKLTKKIIAVILSVAMLGGVFTVLGAAEEKKGFDLQAALDSEQLDALKEYITGTLLGLVSDVQQATHLTISDDFLNYDYDGDGNITALEVAHVMANRAFLTPEIIDKLSEYTADMSDFKVTVTKDGKETVYIAVPIEKLPQLFNLGVFRQSVEHLYADQKKYATEDMDLMSYQHIAGELALHAAVYAATAILGGSRDTSYLNGYVADLNVDETRLSDKMMSAIGVLTEFMIFAYFVTDVVLRNCMGYF